MRINVEVEECRISREREQLAGEALYLSLECISSHQLSVLSRERERKRVGDGQCRDCERERKREELEEQRDEMDFPWAVVRRFYFRRHRRRWSARTSPTAPFGNWQFVK